MKINVELDDRDVRAALEALAASAGDLRPAFEQMGEYLIMSIRQRFQDSVAPDGTPWAPNTETTYLRFLGRFKGSFTKTGKLSKKGAERATGKRPLIGESGSLSTQIVKEVTEDELRVGSTMEYAAVHQSGASKGAFGRTKRGAPIPWGDIPARPFLGLSDGDRAELVAILREHLSRGAR